jgi:hypothetical protein
VRRAGFGSAADHGHVDEVSAAVLAVLATRALHRETQASDLGPVAVPQIRCGGQPSDELYYLDLGLSTFNLTGNPCLLGWRPNGTGR